MSEQLMPNEEDASVYEKPLRGFYGEFKTDSSYPLAYIQSVVPIQNIEILETATEAFSAASLDFEQLIQRDIDEKRVSDIVEKYLSAGTSRVIFFPPLLASIVPKVESAIVPVFESRKLDPKKDSIDITWGGDRFQLVIPISDGSTGYQYIDTETESKYDTHPYWAQLRVNKSKVSLVVIDGQHRLSALKYLALNADSTKRQIVKDIKVPVCFLFSPDAIADNNQSETIERDLRELFVRINRTAKVVSGHFITLLNDKSLSSLSVRGFCDIMKVEKIDEDLSLLNLIEWNQREDKRASQLNRKFSITTVKILADVLSECVFSSKTGGVTLQYLRLESEKSNLESDPNDVLIRDISDDNFSPSQIEKLKDLCITNVSKPLSVLFTNSKPYAEIIRQFKNANVEISKDIAKNIRGSASFKKEILAQHRDINERDQDSTKDASEKFLDSIEIDDYDSVFFSNVFQQGLVRSWVELSCVLHEHDVDNQSTAEAMVKSLEELCFLPGSKLFNSDRVFLQKLLFDGSRYLVNNRSRECWGCLILSTFMNQRVIGRFVEALKENLDISDEKSLVDDISKLATQKYVHYMKKLEQVVRQDYLKNWREKEFEAQIHKHLELLEERIAQGDDDATDEFEKEIRRLTESKIDEASDKLDASLER